MTSMKVKITGLMVFLALLIVGLPVPAEAQQGSGTFPIAVVDVNRVFRDSTQGKNIDQKLKDQGSKLEKDMQAKDAELKKLYDNLITEAQSGKSSKEALEKKEKDLQKRLQDFQTQRTKAIEDMNASAEASLKPLQTKTEKAIEALAKEKGFVLVINSGAVVYAPSSIDITDDIIKAVDKK